MTVAADRAHRGWHTPHLKEDALELPLSTEHALSAELGQSEQLLWSGRPRQGLIFGSYDLFICLFALSWTGIPVWAFLSEDSQQAASVLPFLPFFAIGLYLLVGRFFVDARQRAKTFYGLTNERVIIISGLFSRTVKSLQLRTLSDVSLTQTRGNFGTITFGPVAPWLQGFSASWSGINRGQTTAFDSITQAREVFDQIRDAQKAT